MILDTTFIINVMRKDLKAIEKLGQLIQQRTPLIITTPSLFEVWSGVMLCNKPEEEKRKIAEVLLGQTILEFDKESSEEGGRIFGKITKNNSIEPIDAMIAGIAKTKHEKVLTRNKKDFDKTGVPVETY